MDPRQAEDPILLASFEGLVISTQRKYEGIKRLDPDEVRQVLRLRVWKALLAWDPAEPRTRRRLARGDKSERELLEGFVYGCIANQMKDLLKRDRERDLLIEDAAEGDPWRFEERYLKVEDHAVYKTVEETAPLVPNTLTHDERLVLACMYLGYNGPETALKLDVTRQRVANSVRSIREKMQDWRPRDGAERKAVPEPSLSPTPAVAA